MELTEEAGTIPPLLRLQAMANSMLRYGVVAVCREPDGDVSELFEVELPAIARAIPARQAEFAAGRAAARVALAKLGHPPIALPVADSRGPVWPAGFTGSISHCRGAAIAIAARLDPKAGHVGIDVEEATALEPDLWESTCTPQEMAWLHNRTDSGHWAKLIFSIKEAVYKAQYPLTRRLLDFHDVEISDLDATGTFVAQILGAEVLQVTGRFRADDLFILAFSTAR